MNDIYILSSVALFILFLIIVLIILNSVTRRKEKLKKSLNYTLLSVSQTKNPDAKNSPIEQVQIFEELINSIVPTDKSICFEIAIPNESNDVKFFIAVPNELVANIKTQIRRVYVLAQIEEVDDYTIFSKNSINTLYDITLNNFYGIPINTYKQSNVDTFSSLIGALSNAKDKGTGIALQFVLKSTNSEKAKEVNHVIKQLNNGNKLRHIKPNNAIDSIEATLFSISSWFQTDNKEKDASEKDSAKISLMENKLSKKLFDVNIRLGIASESKERNVVFFESFKSLFSQFQVGEYNGFNLKERMDSNMKINFAFRLFNPKIRNILNSEEIASLFHFSGSSIEIDNVQWVKTKQVAVPNNLINDGILLGNNVFQGNVKKVYLPTEDRMKHLYIIGQTGTGKTTMLKSLAYQDIKNKSGLCIVDPHGDFIDDILSVIPENRLDDLIVFDATDLENPIGINMLEFDRDQPQQKSFITDEILSIFHKLFSSTPEGFGPVFEQYMRNSLLLLMDGKKDSPGTLMEVPRVFTDEEFRNDLIDNCSIQPVKDFWTREAVKVKGEGSLENVTPYITSKFSNFITNDYIRPIISQRHSSFSFRKIMDEGKIFLVKLPKGRISELNMQLLGMIVIGKLTLAALSRDDILESERRDFFLYVDEFQNFTSGSVSSIFSEARKYRLSLTISHQYMKQLSDELIGSVLGNVGSIISFRVGIEDAEKLQKKFAPQFTSMNLTEIENFNCVVSMLSNSRPIDPFTMQTQEIEKGSESISRKIKEYAKINNDLI